MELQKNHQQSQIQANQREMQPIIDTALNVDAVARDNHYILSVQNAYESLQSQIDIINGLLQTRNNCLQNIIDFKQSQIESSIINIITASFTLLHKIYSITNTQYDVNAEISQIEEIQERKQKEIIVLRNQNWRATIVSHWRQKQHEREQLEREQLEQLEQLKREQLELISGKFSNKINSDSKLKTDAFKERTLLDAFKKRKENERKKYKGNNPKTKTKTKPNFNSKYNSYERTIANSDMYEFHPSGGTLKNKPHYKRKTRRKFQNKLYKKTNRKNRNNKKKTRRIR